MGIRERGKRRRRKLILMAARALIVDQGVDGLNMRALADNADLSVATLYNLFGSKEDILLALLDQSFETLNSNAMEVKGANALDRLHAIVDAAVAQFVDDSKFYRPLMHHLNGIEHGAAPSGANLKIWILAEQAARDAVDAGELQDLFPPRLLAQQILSAFVGALRHWVLGRIDDVTFRAQACVGVDMILLSVATDTCRDALQSRIQNNGNIVLQGNPMAVGLDRQDNDTLDHSAA